MAEEGITRETLEKVRELRGLFHSDEPVVGVRNLRDGGCWLPTIEATIEHPRVRLAGKAAAEKGQGRNWGIVSESIWRFLRDHDQGVKSGWLVRDDSVVPRDMLLAQEDPGDGNPNTVLEDEEEGILSLEQRSFLRRISNIDSLVVLERLLARAEDMKVGGATEVYPKAEAIEGRVMLLNALESGMPQEMLDPDLTRVRMQKIAEDAEIELSRETLRSRPAMIKEICSHYLAED